jgi:hypothetical protein
VTLLRRDKERCIPGKIHSFIHAISFARRTNATLSVLRRSLLTVTVGLHYTFARLEKVILITA